MSCPQHGPSRRMGTRCPDCGGPLKFGNSNRGTHSALQMPVQTSIMQIPISQSPILDEEVQRKVEDFKGRLPPRSRKAAFKMPPVLFTVRQLKVALKKQDTDRNGFLTRKEIEETLVDLGLSGAEAKEHVYNYINSDNDLENRKGMIRYKGFVSEWIRMMNFRTLRTVMESDSNKDGFLSNLELRALMTKQLGKEEAEKQLESVLSIIDKSKDGKISYDEYVSWYFSKEQTSLMKQLFGQVKISKRKLETRRRTRKPVESDTSTDVIYECKEKVSSIIEMCSKYQTKFIDTNFPVTTKPRHCMYIDYSRPSPDFPFPAQWQRITAFCDQPKLFGKGTEPGDIVQGCIGSCYLLAAMSTLAGIPGLISKLFVHYDINAGIYGVRLFREGDWHTVIVDDFMPCEDGLPAFAKCRDSNEVWVNVLEKAYAKFHGYYEAIDGGFTRQALETLTGGVADVKLINGYPELSWEELVRLDKQGWFFSVSKENPPSGTSSRPRTSKWQASKDGQYVPLLTDLLTVGKLVNNEGEEIETKSQLGRVIGLYFYNEYSAKCKSTLRRVKRAYKSVQNRHGSESFELIMCPSFKTEESFNNIIASLPWPSIPFNSAAGTSSILARSLGIQSTPAICIFSAKGELITRKGLQRLVIGRAKAFPFKKPVRVEGGAEARRKAHKRREIMRNAKRNKIGRKRKRKSRRARARRKLKNDANDDTEKVDEENEGDEGDEGADDPDGDDDQGEEGDNYDEEDDDDDEDDGVPSSLYGLGDDDEYADVCDDAVEPDYLPPDDDFNFANDNVDDDDDDDGDDDDGPTEGKSGEKRLGYGLYGGHAYSVLQVRELKSGPKLVQIRNPWGESEWTGPWSDGSEEWTDEILAELNYSFGDDGSFWMAWEQFVQQWHELDMCHSFDSSWTMQSTWVIVENPDADLGFEVIVSKRVQLKVDSQCRTILVLEREFQNRLTGGNEMAQSPTNLVIAKVKADDEKQSWKEDADVDSDEWIDTSGYYDTDDFKVVAISDWTEYYGDRTCYVDLELEPLSDGWTYIAIIRAKLEDGETVGGSLRMYCNNCLDFELTDPDYVEEADGELENGDDVSSDEEGGYYGDEYDDDSETEETHELDITVHSARNLANMDKHDKSDPYVVVQILDWKRGLLAQQRSKPQKNTCNPRFKFRPDFTEAFDLPQLSAKKFLRFELWDRDEGSEDDFMGYVEFKLRQLCRSENTEGWFPLRSNKRGMRAKGTLKLDISYNVTEEEKYDENDYESEEEGDELIVPPTLRCQVNNLSLPEEINCYVKVSILDEDSNVLTSDESLITDLPSSNPSLNFFPSFPDNLEDLPSQAFLQIQVYKYNGRKKRSRIGLCIFDLRSIDAAPFTGDYPITDDGNAQASLDTAIGTMNLDISYARYDLDLLQDTISEDQEELNQAVAKGEEAEVQDILKDKWDILNLNARCQYTEAKSVSDPETCQNYLIHAAVGSQKVGIIKALLESGARVDILDFDGYSPLHYAIVLKSALPIIRCLVEYGADPLRPNYAGKSAIELAESCHTPAADLFATMVVDDLDDNGDAEAGADGDMPDIDDDDL